MTLTAAVQLAVDESKVTPGLLGFVVVALLGVATFLLVRSMNHQIRRIDLPEDVEPPAAAEPDEAAAGRDERDHPAT